MKRWQILCILVLFLLAFWVGVASNGVLTDPASALIKTYAEYSFKTISTTSGTSPVADTAADTLTLTAGSGITITGTAASDTVTIAASAVAPGAITLTDTHILVGNSLNLAADVAMSGHGTIVANGTLTLDATVTFDVEWDTVGEIETATSANILIDTEVDTEAELETLLTDVADVFTDNDGALADDDLSDDSIDDLSDVTITAVVGNETLIYDGAAWVNGNLTAGMIPDAITRDTEWDSIGEIETATSVDILITTELDSESELEALLGAVNVIVSTEIDSLGELEALISDDLLTTSDSFAGDVTGNSTNIVVEQATSNFDVGGNLTVTEDADVTGYISADGDIVSTAGSVSAAVDVVASGDVSAGDDVVASGDVSAGANIDATGNITAGENITATGDITCDEIQPSTAMDISDYTNLSATSPITLTDDDIGFDGGLDDLNDTTITSAVEDEILVYDGAGWVNANATALSNLDVYTTITGTSGNCSASTSADTLALTSDDGSLSITISEPPPTPPTVDTVDFSVLGASGNFTVGEYLQPTNPLEPLYGGTGQDSSAWDCVPTVSGGTWSDTYELGDFILYSLIEAKGDLIVGSGAGTADNLGVGANGTILMSIDTETLGMDWRALSGDATIGTDGAVTVITATDSVQGKASFDSDDFTVTAGAVTLDRNRNVILRAASGTPATTSGCADVTQVEIGSGANATDIFVADFDPDTDEYLVFEFALPDDYATDGTSTMTWQFYWTAASGSGNVTWTVAGKSLADGDAIGGEWGTAVSTCDTLTTANDVHVTSTTSAMTFAGTAAANELVVIRVGRDADHASDDALEVDGRFIGVKGVYHGK